MSTARTARRVRLCALHDARGDYGRDRDVAYTAFLRT